jgi:hypothetical protein
MSSYVSLPTKDLHHRMQRRQMKGDFYGRPTWLQAVEAFKASLIKEQHILEAEMKGKKP